MELKDKIVEKLKGIIDPHTNISLYDMGLISDLEVSDGQVSLTFTPSSPFCPLGVQLAMAIKKGLTSMEEISKVDILVKDFVKAEQLNEMLKDA